MVDYTKQRLIEIFLLKHGFTQKAEYSVTYEKNDKSGFKVTIWNDNVFLDFGEQQLATTNRAKDYKYIEVPVDTLISIVCADSNKILARLNNMEIENSLKVLK